MTREEAIHELERMKTWSKELSDEEIEAIVIALKALDQEPFMNKPCVAHQVCHEDKVKVLDKIRERVELEKLGYPPSAGYYRAIMKVLQIIDKYKAESEVQDEDCD